MKKLSLVLLILLTSCNFKPTIDCRITGCSGDSVCVADIDGHYNCVAPEPPPPEPPPPPPEPTPSPVCEPNTNCGCWVKPPNEGWQELKCGEGYECVNNVCVALPPPPPPEPPPPVPGETSCPKKLAPGATLFIRDKAHGHGFDSTLYVKGDPEFCHIIHGVYVDQCHMEGWPKAAECAVELMGGCPVWQYSLLKTNGLACHDDQNDAASCDHFGSPNAQDDPQTPEFEGQPAACGQQRWQGKPDAGFFTVAHGGPVGCTTNNGPYWYIRACLPNDTSNCGAWKPFCH